MTYQIIYKLYTVDMLTCTFSCPSYTLNTHQWTILYFSFFSFSFIALKTQAPCRCNCFFVCTSPEFRCSLIKLTCMCCFHYISLSVKNGFNFAKCMLLEMVCRKYNFPTVSSAVAEVAILIITIPLCVTHKTLGPYIKHNNHLNFPGQ